MEGLLTLLILLLLSGISAWLKRRGQPSEADAWPDVTPPRKPRPAPRPASPRRPSASSWEEELRRLLEGDTPVSPPPPPVQPRPPVLISPPTPVSRPATPPAAARRWDTPLKREPDRAPVRAEAPSAPSVPSHRLEDAWESERRVRELRDRAAQDLKQAREKAQQQSGKAAVHRQARPAELERIVALFRSPITARQAVVASIVLSPPPALAPGEPYTTP